MRSRSRPPGEAEKHLCRLPRRRCRKGPVDADSSLKPWRNPGRAAVLDGACAALKCDDVIDIAFGAGDAGEIGAPDSTVGLDADDIDGI